MYILVFCGWTVVLPLVPIEDIVSAAASPALENPVALQ